MTEPAPPADDRVSRIRFERERRARAEAEALLERKSRELYEANQRLILETEAVRSALAETEAARAQEAIALKERAILSEALAALSGKTSAAEAMQSLLTCLQSEFANFDACFVQADGGTVRVTASARAEHTGVRLPIPVSFLQRSRRVGGLQAFAKGATLPGRTAEYQAVIVSPLVIPDEAPGALLLGCRTAGRFSAGDLRLLDRVAGIASQTLVALRTARRNALLVSLVEGRQVEDDGGVLDAPLEVVHRAFARLTDMQGQVVGILDALLSAPLSQADRTINLALAQMGELTGTDRVYVFRLRQDEDLVDNTHEWCRPGIAPMQDRLQVIPAANISEWHAAFLSGGDVLIPNVAALPEMALEKAVLLDHGTRSLVAVPMMQDGTLRGFVGHDSVLELRSFLPGEVHLVRAVAKVIHAVLSRRDAEAGLMAAHKETTEQRTRLEAVLGAMPDLLVELDPSGRFVTWHSGAIVVPPAVGAAFAGRTLEEMLPPDLAADGRAVLAEVDQRGGSVSRNFRFALPGSDERWWQLSASIMADIGYLFVLHDVTEARAQTAEIERLSQIARRTTNLVVVTDAARRIEWVNAAFEKATGWQLDEIRGKNPGHFLQTSGTDTATVKRLRDALDEAHPVQAEVLNRARDGREYWVSLDIQPLRDQSGILQGFLAMESDVTDRRNQAEVLRQSAEAAALARATLEAAVGALQDGFVLYDSDDRLVICNERYRDIYANSAPAIVNGATFESILRYGLERGEFAAGIGREEAWLAERLANHRKTDSEIEQQLSDGRWLRIFEKATPDGGRVGLRIDITALKLAEKRALADRSTAMEASQEGIAITDAQGNYLYMNRAHLDLFGYETEAQIMGKPWSTLYLPEAAAWMQANVMPALFATGRWSGEIMGISRDGKPVDQEASLTLKEDGGILCIARDMAVRRREMAERDRLQEELQLAQRREIIGQMAAGLAHDFNNLLATISGSASLIEAAAEKGSMAIIGAGRIQAASGQAAGLVKRLLTLGARQSDKVAMDLRHPVREAAELVRASLRAPARLTLHLPEAAVAAVADPTDILQLVLNLAINARDAMVGMPGEITIQLGPATADDLVGPFAVGNLDPSRAHICLSIKDTGPGMTAEQAAQIFKPYFTTKGEKGTGLGLAIVASVVTANLGAVRLITSTGHGTNFRVIWPLDAKTTPTPHPATAGLTGRLDGRTILVVDDQPEVLAVITAFLEAAGAEVAPATDPADVIEALRDDPGAWDLLVTDFDMPGMTGAKLAERAHAMIPGLPIILVTALAGVAGRHGAEFAAVLGKPVDRDVLVSRVEAAIVGAKLNR